MILMPTTDAITKEVFDIGKFLKKLHRRRQSKKLVTGNMRPWQQLVDIFAENK